MSLQKLKKERSVLRVSFTKGKTHIDDLSNKQDFFGLNAEFELFSKRYEELCLKDNAIRELLCSDESLDEAELQDEVDKVDHYCRLFYQTKVLVQNANNNRDTDNVSNCGSVQSCHSNNPCNLSHQLKLPEIKIKEFDGCLKNWLPFWSSFEKIDNDHRLSPSDKLSYLTMAMTPGSSARQLVDSYPASTAMYPVVVEALKSRFGRKDLLIEFYIRELLKIILNNMNSMPISVLYDTLQCHLRNLGSLGVTATNYASILMPLVSSCMPQDLLKIWERSVMTQININNPNASSQDFLQSLMQFLKAEVETTQKLDLAKDAFGLVHNDSASYESDMYERKPTAASLVSNIGTTKTVCLFCTGSHNSTDCQKTMSIEQRIDVIKRKGACFNCLRMGHRSFKCKVKINCSKCNGSHTTIMCKNTKQKNNKKQDKNSTEPQKTIISIEAQQALASYSTNNYCRVLMQTILVVMQGPNGQKKKARLLFDTGSQRSYVLAKTAREMHYEPLRQEEIQHSLFGGQVTEATKHNVYKIVVSNLDMTYHCNFEVLDQHKICGEVTTVPDGPWLNELVKQNIVISDVGSNADIDILVGSDIAGKLWSGGHVQLKSGLVAMETFLGWTLSGKIPNNYNRSNTNVAMLITTLLIKEAEIYDLWQLDTLGITDPTDKSQKLDIEKATREHFLSTVTVNSENRFEVRLPFVSDHPPLSSNYDLCIKRLDNTLNKLKTDGYFEDYNKVFQGWQENGIIERVPPEKIGNSGHYLPHRHVVKTNSTTPVRPVFDASAKEFSKCSLNQCLDKGPNLIEKIPSCLARFRSKKVAISGDIAKAFLQISVNSKDRDFLRFLWKDENDELITFRHCRVVFGVSTSPFLLEASIQLHLEETLQHAKKGEGNFSVPQVQKLLGSFYVDNCVTSLDSHDQADEFINTATSIMKERQFDLRGWEKTGETHLSNPTNILGLLWDKVKDTLSVNTQRIFEMQYDKITKKVILSAAHRLFDPIGIVSTCALLPKILLQQTWEKKLTWTEEVSEDIKNKFIQWLEEIPYLSEIKIPRWILDFDTCKAKLSLHVFSDACKTSYAAVVFLRIEHQEHVALRLLASKSRVSPITKTNKGMTIPRLELLAASIAVRLLKNVQEDYKFGKDVSTTFWTDATTVLAWIKRNEPWDVFVMNRVKEIRELSEFCLWKHVPGEMNPADFPSRGSTPKKYVNSKWWEGPSWLKEPSENWPLDNEIYEEEEVLKERKRMVVSSMPNTHKSDFTNWSKYFSQYKKLVRMIGWILRFYKNCKSSKEKRFYQDLTADEFKVAERKIMLLIQRESFIGLTDSKLSSLMPFLDESGIIRIKTKVSNLGESKDFTHPIVLPKAQHPVVKRIILDVHKENCHAGTQLLLAILRQQFWILGGRRTIKSVLNTCAICKRYTSKKFNVVPTPLPESRVRQAKLFEVTGVDLAGPLFIKDNNGSTTKVWVCLFTCALYRAVRLELVSSLSTDSFLQAFRRFCSRHGRPQIVYSDQGSNFTGFVNASNKLDWEAISQYSSARKIDWRFNPPSSPWWGGWWERLIGILKGLLRRVLGRISVNYEELTTILCDCESVINSRPLTYLSEDSSDLTFLTPSMFLHDIEEVGVPEYMLMDSSGLRERIKYKNDLRKQLHERFKLEYLGQLRLNSSPHKEDCINVGDIVFIGDDNIKRMSWPIGRIIELIVGKDGRTRVVRLNTTHGVVTRPIQRLYPLEADKVFVETIPELVKKEHEDMSIVKNVPKNTTDNSPTSFTRRGRAVKVPSRFND